MADLNLPEDLREFLRAGKQPEYDASKCKAGRVSLHSLDELKCELFPVSPEGSRDPHDGESGSYLVKAVSLIASCENYRPTGVLVWLPLDHRYGTWDQAHYKLHVFGPKVSWSEIAADFPRYINAQWDPKASATVASMTPWVHHTYNVQQVSAPLPDLAEWYEAEWLRRGVFRNGVQERLPEELRIRVERHGNNLEVTSQIMHAVENAEWSLPKRLSVSLDEWRKLEPKLEQGFWNESERDRRGLVREPDSSWSLQGYKTGKYHSFTRFYADSGARGQAPHELGKKLAELAKAGNSILTTDLNTGKVNAEGSKPSPGPQAKSTQRED